MTALFELKSQLLPPSLGIAARLCRSNARLPDVLGIFTDVSNLIVEDGSTSTLKVELPS